MSEERTKILITVEGGVIQNVETEIPSRVLVVNVDNILEGDVYKEYDGSTLPEHVQHFFDNVHKKGLA